MTTAWLDAASLRPSTSAVHERVEQLTAGLLDKGYETAPHVVATLARCLNSDPDTVHEVAAALTPAQRRGHRALPLVLPLTPTVVDLFDGDRWRREERFLLLLASLCTVQLLDLLVEASGVDAESIAAGQLGASLRFDHGRFEFIDLRLSVWVLGTASPHEITRAHARLQEAHAAWGEDAIADWHRARGALLRTPDVVSPLLTEARELAALGYPERGLYVAAEAAEHAGAAEQQEARVIAGAAMVGAGLVHDAVDWLGGLFPGGAREHRADALSCVLIAEACVHGTVPVVEPAEHRPRSEDAVHWQGWARTAGLAASLCAERGAHSAMRLWLSELREADARAGAAGKIRDPAVALCWMLTGEAEPPDLSGVGRFSGGVIGALRAALNGDLEAGLRAVSKARAGLVCESDPLVVGLEHTPLVEAYLLVTEVLLHFWRGDIGIARTRLLSAVTELPLGLPFAGLGSTLAYRLDIAVLGSPGALAQALAKTLPSGIRVDRLVDRALDAYLSGRNEQAVRTQSLWHDRGAPEHPLAIPGLDEVGPLDENTHIEPPEQATARELRRRIRSLPEASWQREHADLVRIGRSLQSPFERGRVEAMLGAVSAIRGDSTAGRRHLHLAQSLFDDAGALAWSDATAARIRRLRAQQEAHATAETVPIAVIEDTDPVAVSRSAWAPLLTQRELDVALRVIEGMPNRKIAETLDISVRTIEVHTGRVFAKLGVRNRVQLTVLAHRTARHL